MQRYHKALEIFITIEIFMTAETVYCKHATYRILDDPFRTTQALYASFSHILYRFVWPYNPIFQ